MNRSIFLLTFGLVVVSAVPSNPNRIIGGSVTSIGQYPFAVAMLFSNSGSGHFGLSCGGAIMNQRSVLSAAHCYSGDRAFQWRARVGSTNSHSGGVVHNIAGFFIHPQYSHNLRNFNNDVAVVRVSPNFSFNNNVRIGQIAGPNYNAGDNQAVWAIGWGRTSVGGPTSEQLRHVQVWTVNQQVCRNRYSRIRAVTDNMLCSGWLDVGGRDQCQGDSGGPLLHNNVIIGVSSWGESCAHAYYPGVNVRVSRYTSWIQNNS